MVHRNHLCPATTAALLLLSAVGAARAADPAQPNAAADAAPAVIRVTLPPDATLAIDGEPTKSTSAERTFITPPLETGKAFHYIFKAVFVRGDQTVTVEQRVAVRAGRETAVSLNPPSAVPNRAGEESLYYSPAAPAARPYSQPRPLLRYDVISPPVDAHVGGARDNWQPDFSDPFLRGPG